MDIVEGFVNLLKDQWPQLTTAAVVGWLMKKYWLKGWTWFKDFFTQDEE